MLTNTFAQKITKEEAINYAEKLHEVEILSENGKNHFVNTLNNHLVTHPDFEIEKQLLYKYLEECFEKTFLYRTGTFEMMKVQDELSKKYLGENVNQENYKKLREEFEKIKEDFYKNWEGLKIEEAIVSDESYEGKISFTGSVGDYDDENMIESLVVGKRYKVDIDFFDRKLGEETLQKLTKDLIHKNRSAFGKTFSKTMEDLFQIGLITEEVYNKFLEVKPKIKERTERMSLLYVKKIIEDIEGFDDENKEQIKFIKELYEARLLEKSSMEKLSIYKEKKLKSDEEILSHSKQVKIFDENDFSADNIQEGYQQIFEELKQIIPGFDFSDLKISFEKEKDVKVKRVEIQIEFKSNNTTYKLQDFYDYLKEGEKLEFKISSELNSVINKYLRDVNSTKRLHQMSGYKYSKHTFLYLNKKQRTIWEKEGEYSGFFKMNFTFDNQFSTAEIEKIIKKLKKKKFFKHLTKEEYQEGLKNIDYSFINSIEELLLKFPKTIVGFDWESENLENPYEELALDFGEASRGVFKPKNIKDTFEETLFKKEKTLFSFEFEDKVYLENLVMQGDWLHRDFLYLIIKAISENGHDGKIYTIGEPDQYQNFIFLNEKQYEFLKESFPELYLKEFK